MSGLFCQGCFDAKYFKLQECNIPVSEPSFEQYRPKHCLKIVTLVKYYTILTFLPVFHIICQSLVSSGLCEPAHRVFWSTAGLLVGPSGG